MAMGQVYPSVTYLVQTLGNQNVCITIAIQKKNDGPSGSAVLGFAPSIKVAACDLHIST